ncbi:ankyrin repeat-containing protein BDA1-like [Mangifera indica]|uniref:ankyrin repeat-containing protein BDA1-like n=1 Tax=Mangifera indica TaxID=29780 RepID=UPI001CFC367A|nr:ankyrin repeat-containing protein BDA1-like [Mangifera indica]
MSMWIFIHPPTPEPTLKWIGFICHLTQLDKKNDPFILYKISLTRFTGTPLHISALLGHVEFTKAIVSQKPQLGAELDTFELSPLHPAVAEGHSEIVKELLLANKDSSMFTDQEGRNPLHLAAIRGRVEVIKELISAKPESIFEPIRGETALHLCVKHNHLGALKVLVTSVDDEEFLNFKNLEGNSILQVSTMLQQYETTSYLLSVPKHESGFELLDQKWLSSL